MSEPNLQPSSGETVQIVVGGPLWASQENVTVEELDQISNFFKCVTEGEARRLRAEIKEGLRR